MNKQIIILLTILFPSIVLAQPVVKIVPLGKVSAQHISAAEKVIHQYLPQVVVMKKEAMPKDAYYQPRNRYRADKLINWLHSRAGNNEVYIGVTDQDISHTNGTNPDYGIMGLARSPGKGCVASSFRSRAGFTKVVIHELGHTTGLRHCPTQGCFMMAANGKNHTASLTGFCAKCKKHLKSANWNVN